MLQVLAGSDADTFYRDADHLGFDGAWHVTST